MSANFVMCVLMGRPYSDRNAHKYPRHLLLFVGPGQVPLLIDIMLGLNKIIGYDPDEVSKG